MSIAIYCDDRSLLGLCDGSGWISVKRRGVMSWPQRITHNGFGLLFLGRTAGGKDGSYSCRIIFHRLLLYFCHYNTLISFVT